MSITQFMYLIIVLSWALGHISFCQLLKTSLEHCGSNNVICIGITNHPLLIHFYIYFFYSVAWVSSIIVAVCCFFGPVMGAFISRFGIRIAIIAGCLSCSAGLTMGSFVSQKMIVLLYLTFSLPFGIGLSVIYVSATVIASHYFVKRRSIALGLLTAGQGLGTMILGPALQASVDILDWRNSFRVFAGVLFVVSLTGVFLHQGTSSPNERKEPPSRKFKFNLNVLKNPGVIIRIVLAGIYTFSRMAPYVHLVSITLGKLPIKYQKETIRGNSYKETFICRGFL